MTGAGQPSISTQRPGMGSQMSPRMGATMGQWSDPYARPQAPPMPQISQWTPPTQPAPMLSPQDQFRRMAGYTENPLAQFPMDYGG